MNTSSLEQAQQFFAKGKIDSALYLLKLNHSDPACLVRLREYYMGERQIEHLLPIITRLSAGDGAEAFVSKSIKALIDGDINTAIDAAQRALRMSPPLATAHNHLARALFNAGEADKAMSHFEQAIELNPQYPEALHNIALVKRVMGDLDGAIAFYERSLSLSPAYRSAKLNLAITLSLTEQNESALTHYQTLVQDHPQDTEILVNAGLVYQTLGELNTAKAHYERAIDIDSSYSLAYCYLGILLNEQFETQAAIEAFKRSIELNPAEIEAMCELANLYEKNNQLDKAEAIVRQGYQLDPRHPGVLIEAAKLNRRQGHSQNALALLQSLNPQQLPQRQAIEYFYELGTVQDANQLYDESIKSFNQANAFSKLNARRKSIDTDAFYRQCESINKWLGEGAKGSHADIFSVKDSGEDLCFLLGFSRSGTTLLDTILDAHPDMVSLEELPTIETVIQAIEQNQHSAIEQLKALSDEALEKYRSLYRETVKKHIGDTKAKLVIDKLPLRTIHIPIIQRLFPKAKILFSLRHPYDVVLSNFMQNYAPNTAFVHFDTISDSIKMYKTVMQIWMNTKEHLKLDYLYTRYEDLIENSNNEVQKLCDFLGVDIKPSMLEHESRIANRAQIKTNSYHQVVQPIYTRSVYRWHHYEKHLSSYRETILPFAEEFGYNLDKE